MKKYGTVFCQMFLQIKKDSMLFIMLCSPILAGLFFKFCIPLIEGKITILFQVKEMLVPFYKLFDSLLALMLPFMMGYIIAMILLGERDDNIMSYLLVTPVGRRGYFIARLVLPMTLSALGSIMILGFFSLLEWNFLTLLLIGIFSAIIGLMIAFFIFVFSTNKVEGMAIGKLSGLILVGIGVPFFIPLEKQYYAGILPSFWLGKFIELEQIWFYIFGLVVSFLWLFIFYHIFLKKIQRE